jgi:hypothetical protein
MSILFDQFSLIFWSEGVLCIFFVLKLKYWCLYELSFLVRTLYFIFMTKSKDIIFILYIELEKVKLDWSMGQAIKHEV